MSPSSLASLEVIIPRALTSRTALTARIKSGLAPGRELKTMQVSSDVPAMRLIVHYLDLFHTVAANQDGGAFAASREKAEKRATRWQS